MLGRRRALKPLLGAAPRNARRMVGKDVAAFGRDVGQLEGDLGGDFAKVAQCVAPARRQRGLSLDGRRVADQSQPGSGN